MFRLGAPAKFARALACRKGERRHYSGLALQCSYGCFRSLGDLGIEIGCFRHVGPGRVDEVEDAEQLDATLIV